MLRKMLPLIAAGGLVLVATAYAHHSIDATYLSDKEITLEGKILLFEFRNPHSFLQIEAPDKEGTLQRWSLEWRSSGRLGQDGIKRDTLKIGEVVTVTGNPSRTAADHRALLKTLRRKSDGFGWGGPGQAVD
jgi:uncharacterized protein DUF6152